MKFDNNLQSFIVNELKHLLDKYQSSRHKNIIYLNYEYIIELNKVAIKLFNVKKGDKHNVISLSKLMELEKGCISYKGDFYDKASFLLKSIVKEHVFDSGNRRTALLAVLVFSYQNFKKVYIPNDTNNSKVLVGIRDNYYSDIEIKEWLKNGKIKKFQRFQG